MKKVFCLDCARIRGVTCCECVQIYVTQGDIERITSFTSSKDFFLAAPMKGVYRDCDPDWKNLVLNRNRRRNIIKLSKNGKCVFLKRDGCLLPVTVRPLLCRIHPYDFNETGITGIYKHCPIAKMPNAGELLNAMGMSIHKAKRWHAILYREIREEKLRG